MAIDKRNLVAYSDPFIRLHESVTGLYKVKGLESMPILISQILTLDPRTGRKAVVQYIVTTKREFDGSLMFGPDMRPADRPKAVREILSAGVATVFTVALMDEYRASTTRDPKEFNSWLRAIVASVSK